MQAYFTRRAQAAGIVTGALSLATLAELHGSDPALYGRLTGRALPLVIAAGLCGLAVLALLAAGRPRGVRVLAAAGVAAVIWGWGVAQYPVLLPGTDVTLSNAGAPHSTLVAVVVVFVAAVLIVGPSFALLFSMQGRRLLRADDDSGAALALRPPPSAGPLARPRPTEAPPAVRAAVVAFVLVDALLGGRRQAR